MFQDINEGHNIYPNAVDCASESTCVVAIEGDHSAIWLTTDGGQTWSESLRDEDQFSSLVAVKFVSKSEVWVAGGGHIGQEGMEGRFWHSTDGGVTFAKEAVPNLYVLDLDVPSPRVGFAVGLTRYDTAELLRFRNATAVAPLRATLLE